MKRSLFRLACFAVSIDLVWTAALSAQTMITLDPKSVKWSVDGKDLPIRSVISPVAEGVLRGGLRIGTDKNGNLVANEEPGNREAWRLKAEKDCSLVPAHLSDDAVFFQVWTRKAKESGAEAKILDSRSLRRASIKTGAESPPFAMPAETAKDESIAALVVEGGMVFAAALAPEARSDFYERGLRYARIVAWNESGGQPLWSKKIEYRGVASPGAALLSPGGPDYATTGLRLISAGGAAVFACTGPHDAITAFEQKTGKELWTQAEIWEYRRGFIGPSVWSHFIGRFGREDRPDSSSKVDSSKSDRELKDEAEDAVRIELKLRTDEPKKENRDFTNRVERKLAALKAESKKEKAALANRCRIIGGPVFAGKEDAARIFVAVSEAEGPWGGYLATCRMLELSAATGEPVAIIHLPRSVAGTDLKVIDDGVLWRCQGGALARIRAGTEAPVVTMGGGGSDGLGQLVWYREIVPGDVGEKPWLQTGAYGDPWIFSESSIIRLPAGGFISKSGDTTMHFPVEKLDLVSGKSVRGLLSLGISPALELPESNYRTRTDPGGIVSVTTTRGTYGAAITRMEQEGDSLILTVATESGSNVRVLVPAL